MTALEKINTSRKGDFAEYYAVTWLWDQGFEVFQNCGCSGPVDMVAMSPEGDIILIDVKTMTTNGGKVNNTNKLQPSQMALGVHKVAFNPETRELFFVNHYNGYETTYTRYRDKQQSQLDLDSSDTGC